MDRIRGRIREGVSLLLVCSVKKYNFLHFIKKNECIHKYLLCTEDGDAKSETSSYSDTSTSRPPSVEPDSSNKCLSRRQKRNLKKRPPTTTNTIVINNKRKSITQVSQEWLNLGLSENQFINYVKPYLLSAEDMLSLGYPLETPEGNIIIYKGTDSPRVIKENKFVLDANAREFVPKSQRTDSDSGNGSGSSGNTSDSSESFDSWEIVDKKKKTLSDDKNKKSKFNKYKKEPLIHKHLVASLNSYSKCASTSSGSQVNKVPNNNVIRSGMSSETVQFPCYTYMPTLINNGAHFKYETFYDKNGRSYEQMVLNHPMYPQYATSSKVTVHLCARCGDSFQMQDGIYIGYNKCHYHYGKVHKHQGQLRHLCCNQPPDSKPCTESTYHVWNGLQMGFNGPFSTYKKTKQRKTLPKDGNFGIYGVDCEMVYTDHGLEAVKVTVVGADGRVVYEAMIKPEHEILDYNTYYSGITEKDLIQGKSLGQVQNDLMGFINANTILVGHGLENDLRALKLVHKSCIDTSALFPHHNGLPFKRSLKTLVRSYLNKNIQKDNQPHNSYDDAASCMDLILWKVRNDSNKRM